jgi:hypothetical protein
MSATFASRISRQIALKVGHSFGCDVRQRAGLAEFLERFDALEQANFAGGIQRYGGRPRWSQTATFVGTSTTNEA